jgi:hypothetical protein
VHRIFRVGSFFRREGPIHQTAHLNSMEHGDQSGPRSVSFSRALIRLSFGPSEVFGGSRDRLGHSTPLSRPTCAPRATSSRVDSLFEPRREIRGGDPPRIPPTARSPPGCSRATLGFDIQLSGVRHPRLVRPDRPSARVTSRSRTRAASACFLSRDTADTRLTDERLLDRRCARADDSRGSRAAPASRRVHPILLEAC